jgi:hypothetical protein
MDDHVETFYSVTGGRGMDSSNPMAITQFWVPSIKDGLWLHSHI